MMRNTIILSSLATIGLINAQTTYTGCHNDTTSGTAIEYCFGPDNVESARATYLPASVPASITAVTTAGAAAQTTAITDCHPHGSTALYCVNGAGSEVLVEATPTGEPPAEYTDCHSHDDEMFCVDPEGNDVAVHAEGDDHDHDDHEAEAVGATGQTTAVTSCHAHETAIFCINGAGSEVQVQATVTGEVPAAYTACHAHDAEQFCQDPEGSDVLILAQGASADTAESSDGENCHFHAGVEHCGSHSSSEPVSCGIRDREYNVGLRVGTLFAVLITSAIGVFAPMLLQKLPLGAVGAGVLLVVKQFGTGIIISTAFIHLYTHAELMFKNPCIGSLTYEATTSAVVMAGLLLAFLVEYIGIRIIASRTAKETPSSEDEATAFQSQQATDKATTSNALTTFDHHHHPGSANTKLSVLVMEAGILFHSILIGLTLVVAGDSFYRTLLIVIIFHQFFEGLALGARIALLPGAIFPSKVVMATAFALITPLGMAIGIGVLGRFNGNDSGTVIAIGTLDAVSAGILIWAGVVDMWARDWVVEGGEMVNSGALKTVGAGVSLILGMVLMGVLGKWA